MNQSLPCPRQYFNTKVYCVALLPREPSAMLASLLGSACHSPLAVPGKGRSRKGKDGLVYIEALVVGHG